jgi:hypothetical protein
VQFHFAAIAAFECDVNLSAERQATPFAKWRNYESNFFAALNTDIPLPPRRTMFPAQSANVRVDEAQGGVHPWLKLAGNQPGQFFASQPRHAITLKIP